MADFCLVSRRVLNDDDHRLFRFYFLLGADWNSAPGRINMDRGNFFHAIYRIERLLGRAFSELQPYPLYPLDEYFGAPSARYPMRPSTYRGSAEPAPRRRRCARSPDSFRKGEGHSPSPFSQPPVRSRLPSTIGVPAPISIGRSHPHTGNWSVSEQIGPGKWSPRATAIMLLAANIPDADVVSSAGGSLNYLNYHRHLTHSFLLAPVMALAAVAVVRVVGRKAVSWPGAFAAALLAVASHLHSTGRTFTEFGCCFPSRIVGCAPTPRAWSICGFGLYSRSALPPPS